MAAGCAEAGDLAEAMRLQEEAGPGLELLVVLFPAPVIAFRRGDWERARAMWTEAFERHRRTGSRWCEADFACWLAHLYRIQDDLSAAEAVLRGALAIGTAAPSPVVEMWTRPELARLSSQEGRLAEAEQHLVRCRAIVATGEEWRGLAGRLALAEAVSASACNDLSSSERWFDRSRQIFQRWSLPWAEAEALCEWGRALALAGRRSFAREKYNAARGVYLRYHAGERWLSRVDALEDRD
jgi:hypothetical protein